MIDWVIVMHFDMPLDAINRDLANTGKLLLYHMPIAWARYFQTNKKTLCWDAATAAGPDLA